MQALNTTGQPSCVLSMSIIYSFKQGIDTINGGDNKNKKDDKSGDDDDDGHKNASLF